MANNFSDFQLTDCQIYPFKIILKLDDGLFIKQNAVNSNQDFCL